VKLKINPFDSANPMSFRDAAIVSTVSSFAVWALTFLANASLGQIRLDPAAFAFDCVKTYLAAWAGQFLSLTGLAQLTKPSEAKPSA
jgi:hypothetical protein